MGHHYPFASNDRLTAAELDVTFELSRSVVPPSGLAGGAGLGKEWLDISVAPPALRMVTANQATAGAYVASEWATLGTLDIPNRQFNYSGGWAGNLNITGNIIRMDGCPPSAGTVGAGGPLIYADQTGFVVKQGTSNAGILLLNNTGGQDALLSSQGLYILNKLIVNTVTNPVPYNFVYSTDGRQAISLGANITINRAATFEWDTPDPINLMTLDNTTGLYIHHNAIVASKLLVGGNITTNQPYMYFSGVDGSTTPGPSLYGGTDNWAVRSGVSNGKFIFYDYTGTTRAYVNFANGDVASSGTVYANNFAANSPGYIYLSTAVPGSGVVGPGGPLIYADVSNFVVKLGSSNNSFDVFSYTGTTLFAVNGAGDANVIRQLTVSGNVGGIAISAPNGDIVGGNDIAAHGVFRLHTIPEGGAKGARIECWAGDWGSIQFAMAEGALIVSSDGGVSGFSLTTTGSFSDARLKTDIRDTQVDALDVICGISVRAFEWNDKGRELMPWAVPVACGLVAHELEAMIPAAVSVAPFADEPMYINDQYLTPYIIRAIQQIADRLDAGGL